MPHANTYNNANTFSAIKIPGLGNIPILGPIFFDSTIFLYITYAAIIAVQVGLFSTRWGLRVRAVGEHPTAADTVGIKVNGIRYGNLIMGGMLAGIGGAYLTIGSVGTFSKDMSSGLGYIALAAMIFGRWTPLGATAAALLFGFTEALQSFMGSITVPISPFLLGDAALRRHDHRRGRAWSARSGRQPLTANRTCGHDRLASSARPGQRPVR